MMLNEVEHRKGIAIGATRLVPTLETARSMELVYEIAKRDRVTALGGAAARSADTERALGYVWSADGREVLYLKSRVVMAARAAGKAPLGGSLATGTRHRGTACLPGTRSSTRHDRGVPAAPVECRPRERDVQSVSGRDRLLRRHDRRPRRGGRGSPRHPAFYDGEHIDIAHVETARQIVAMAASVEN